MTGPIVSRGKAKPPSPYRRAKNALRVDNTDIECRRCGGKRRTQWQLAGPDRWTRRCVHCDLVTTEHQPEKPPT